ncbi:cold-shock protein [Ferroacidibacillus organovorans]|uniref:cold-shock protein n=1 Tax=Ferroacidibacillus organovorans TaxID=1765683 RepID=UPI0030103263
MFYGKRPELKQILKRLLGTQIIGGIPLYFRKEAAEEVIQEITSVWLCTKESCNGWMRDNFAFDESPACGLCQSPMVKDTKLLPQLQNLSMDMKVSRRGVKIN